MDEVVLALEGAIAPMDCFVDDRDGARAVLARDDDGAALRDQAAVDARADGRHQVAAARPTLAELVEFAGAHRDDRPDPPWRPMADLEIRNLHVCAGDKQILKGVDLHVRSGEIHALMGPNGSGKSTLANAIMGHPNLEVTEGQILFDGEDITEADPDERARAGLFMAFQYPVAIPGVTVTKYLRMVMNAHREARGEEPISLKDFRKTVEAAMELTQRAAASSRSRYLNEGFSGGEKKRMEILQLALQKPDAGGARRDRLGPRHRRAEHRRPRRQHRRRGDRHGRADHHPLPAHPAPGGAAVRAHHVRGPDRQGGRPGARRAARGAAATAGSARRSRRPA